jgi:hypothetical protein
MDKAIAALPQFNFWVMLYLLIKEKHPTRISAIKRPPNEVEKNSTFKVIYDAYYKLLITYIARKNIITVLITFPIWKKILDNYLSLKSNDKESTFSNTDECIAAEEYTFFAFYIQSASAKSLLLG